MIDLYYWFILNGYKVILLLEEIGLEYCIYLVNIGLGDQFKLEFFVILFNNKMLVIVDYVLVDGGVLQSVFEFGVILLYLVEKIGCFLFIDLCGCVIILEWLFWQMVGLGLMSGQMGYFNVYVLEKILYVIECYDNEVCCLYGVMDKCLVEYVFLVGDEYIIVDMVSYFWIGVYDMLLVDFVVFFNFKCWYEVIVVCLVIQCVYVLCQQVNLNVGKLFSDEECKYLFGQC